MAQNPNQARMYQYEQNLLESIRLFLPDLTITIHDLRNPSPEFVSKFYNAFLEELGANTTNLLQIQMNQMPLLSHIDMYNSTVPMLNQYQSINYFLTNIGINDFYFSDLVNPCAKKTVRHFSAVTDFLTYCDETIGSLQPEMQKIADQRNKRDELLSKIELLRKDINQRATARVERKKKIKELEKSIEKDTQKLEELIHEKEMHISAQNDVKKRSEQCAEEEARFVRIMKNLDEDIEELRSRIVEAPDKLKHDLVELKKKHLEGVEQIESLKTQIEEKKKQTDQMEQDRDNQETRHKKLGELFEIQKIIQEKQHEKDILTNENSRLQEEVEEIKQNIVNQNIKYEGLKETHEELYKRREKQELDKKSLLENAEKELNALILKRKQKQKYVNSIQKEINELHEVMQKLENEAKQYKKIYLEKHEKLCISEQRVVEDFQKVLDKLKANRIQLEQS